jgi:hypothetical protein
MSKVTDASSIQIGKHRMTVSNAIHLGYLSKDVQGNYVMTDSGKDVHQANLTAQSEAKEQAIKEAQANMPVDQKAAQTASTLAQRGGPGVHALMADAVEGIINNDEASVSKAVGEIETSAGAQGVEGFVKEYATQAADGLLNGIESQLGHNADQVYEFATGNIPARELATFMTAYARGDRSVIDHIQNKYESKFRVWNSKRMSNV